MLPRLDLLTPSMIAQVLDEAFQLMEKPGIKVQSARARDLLCRAGARANEEVVTIPERIVREALQTVPEEFELYDREGTSHFADSRPYSCSQSSRDAASI